MRATRTDRYLDCIAGLPLPTPDQTARFARFVAEAHSWYKHLPPVPPGAEFFFYLDPHAGRERIQLPTGDVAFADRVDESTRFHYTWMLTSEYREQFGYWQYHTEWGTRILCGSERAGWRAVDAPARVLDGSGDWLSIARRLGGLGRCRLTSFVHPLPPRSQFYHLGERQLEALAEVERRRAARPRDPELRRYAPVTDLARRYHECCSGPPADFDDLDAELARFHEAEQPRLVARIESAMRRALRYLRSRRTAPPR